VNCDTQPEEATPEDERSKDDVLARHLRFKVRVTKFLEDVGERVRQKKEQVDLDEQKFMESTAYQAETPEHHELPTMSLRQFIGELRSMEVIQHVRRLSDQCPSESVSLPSTPGAQRPGSVIRSVSAADKSSRQRIRVKPVRRSQSADPKCLAPSSAFGPEVAGG